MTTLEVITVVKDIIVACAAVATISLAIYGLKSWGRELRGKASFDVARSLIIATYKLRDELSYSRSIWIMSGEFPNDYSSYPKDKTAEKEALAWAYVFSNRWKPVAEAQLEFEAQVLEAEALWGSEIKTYANKLRQCAKNLRVAMDAMISNYANDGGDFKSDPDFGKEIKADVYVIKNETNKLSIKIMNAVGLIEASVRPHIKRN